MRSGFSRGLRFALVLLLCALSPLRAMAEGFSAAVPYGGEISKELTQKLTYGAGWIQALHKSSEILRETQTVRLAELDAVGTMALAAMLDMYGIRLFSSRFLSDENGRSYNQEEGESIAYINLAGLDEAALGRAMAQQNQRRLYEEIVVEIDWLVKSGLELTTQAADRRLAMRTLELQNPRSGNARVPILQAEPDYILELEQINQRLDACFSYLDLLRNGPVWQSGRDAESVIDQCLKLYPESLPFLIAKAQLLMRQDRAVVAMRFLANIELPQLVWTMDEYLYDNAAYAQSAFRVAEDLQARFLQVRSVAWLASAEPRRADADLSRALDIRPDRVELWHSRGAVRQVMQDYENMCLDYYQACRMGECLGLSTARDNGHCLNQNL